MGPRRLLVTDIDGTFLGDDDASRHLWRAAADADITMVFATGRRIEGVRAVIEDLGLDPLPPAAICQVGTELWMAQNSSFSIDSAWSERLSDGWDPDMVDEIVDAVPELQRQGDIWQTPYKRSWFVPDGSADWSELVGRQLDQAGVAARVIVSGDRWLDVLPARAGKGTAAAFLAGRWGVPPSAVVTAGDTGNDLDMMRPELGFRSIVVGNAHADLSDLRGSHVHRSVAPHANGVLEGLVTIGWLTSPG